MSRPEPRVRPGPTPTEWLRRLRPLVIIEAYSEQKTSALLRRLAFFVGRARQSSNPTLIVDLCNALERFDMSLFLFVQFYPRAQVRKIRRRVRKLSRLSRHVHEHDVALAFLRHARQRPGGQFSAHRRKLLALYNHLSQQRKLTLDALREYIRKFSRREWSKRWRVRLGA